MTYTVQIDDLVREATPEEIEVIEAQKAEYIAQIQIEEQKLKDKADLLTKLGITAEEAALLLS